MEPMIPVIIIATTVTDKSPPNCFDSAIPIGVVIDLDIKDSISWPPLLYSSYLIWNVAKKIINIIIANNGIKIIINLNKKM